MSVDVYIDFWPLGDRPPPYNRAFGRRRLNQERVMPSWEALYERPFETVRIGHLAVLTLPEFSVWNHISSLADRAKVFDRQALLKILGWCFELERVVKLAKIERVSDGIDWDDRPTSEIIRQLRSHVGSIWRPRID